MGLPSRILVTVRNAGDVKLTINTGDCLRGRETQKGALSR